MNLVAIVKYDQLTLVCLRVLNLDAGVPGLFLESHYGSRKRGALSFRGPPRGQKSISCMLLKSCLRFLFSTRITGLRVLYDKGWDV